MVYNWEFMDVYVNESLTKGVKNIVERNIIKKDFSWQYLYILSHIRTAPFFDRSQCKNGYTNVNATLLRKICSYDHSKNFLKHLMEEGLIACDELYIPSIKSKGYKIVDKYLVDKFKLVKIADKDFSKKLKDIVDKNRNELLMKKDGYGYVTACLDNLDLDRKKALRFIRTIPKTEKNRIDFCQMVADNFSKKFGHKDEVASRLHNNLTNMPTEFRNFLSYKGQRLGQCDIRNSQPVFLYVYAKSNLFICEKELDKYKEVVCNYGFYEFFADKLKVKLTNKNRRDFKKQIFAGVLFDRNREVKSKYEIVFEEEFPELYYVIRSMKDLSHNNVAIQLQKVESKFIFSCVEEIMKRTDCRIPLLTIHDSIASTLESMTTVLEVISDKFNKDFDINPKIHYEEF